MEIEKINLNGHEFRMFRVLINNESFLVAEEKLEEYIQEMIENDRYHFVQHIDEMYAMYIPQEIADTENGENIIQSVSDVLKNSATNEN